MRRWDCLPPKASFLLVQIGQILKTATSKGHMQGERHLQLKRAAGQSQPGACARVQQGQTALGGAGSRGREEGGWFKQNIGMDALSMYALLRIRSVQFDLCCHQLCGNVLLG